MRITSTVFVLVVGSILGGCGSSQPQESTADCNNQVRIDGRVYTSYAMTDREGTRFGVADRADCLELFFADTVPQAESQRIRLELGRAPD